MARPASSRRSPGTGVAGFSGDFGPAVAGAAAPAAQHRRRPGRPAADLRHRQPSHSRRRPAHRHHRDDRRHGRAPADARRCSAEGHTAERSAHDGDRSRRNDLSRAARGERALSHRSEDAHAASPRRHRRAGLDGRWRSGSRGEARRAQRVSHWPARNLYVADTESHTIRRVNLDTGIITTVLGAGVRGDGPETDPLQCKLSRPHGLFAATDGTLYVTDSEAHRIRVLKP